MPPPASEESLEPGAQPAALPVIIAQATDTIAREKREQREERRRQLGP